MGLTVPLWKFTIDSALFLAIGYAAFYAFRRVSRYTGSLHRLILYSAISLALATAGRILDLLGDFSSHYKVMLRSVVSVIYFVSIIGIIYALLNYIAQVERRIFPEACTKHGELKVEPGSYLFLFDEPEEILDLLEGTTAAILAITRNPELYNELGNRVRRIWVSMAVETAIPPTKLHMIQDVMIRFLKSAGRGIVVVDCVEYLTLYNDFDTIFKFLTALKDYVTVMNSTLVVAIKRGTLSERELKLLEREFRRIEELIAEE